MNGKFMLYKTYNKDDRLVFLRYDKKITKYE